MNHSRAPAQRGGLADMAHTKGVDEALEFDPTPASMAANRLRTEFRHNPRSPRA